MTIRERILARPDLADALAARDIDLLAAGLNAQPEMTVQSRYITGRTILAECANGADILAALDAAAPASAAVKYAVQFLSQDSGLDIGNPVTLAMLPQVMAPELAEQVKALALQPVYVTRMDVESAMFNPDGTDK